MSWLYISFGPCLDGRREVAYQTVLYVLSILLAMERVLHAPETVLAVPVDEPDLTCLHASILVF